MLELTDACRSCGAKTRVEILYLGEMPRSDGLLREADLARREQRFPLTVLFCPACTLVQLHETVAPELLFCDDYPYFSSFSEGWVRHSRRNAEELIGARGLGPRSRVVEIACNDGYLLRHFAERGIPVLGIDPAAGPAAAARALGLPVREEFFTAELARDLAASGGRADVVLANNVLAHVADLGGFVEGIGHLLADSGIAVLEVPYVRDLVDRCEFDTIYHEHLCYFSVTALDRLFRGRGLTLQDVRRLETHGGSLRLYVGHAGSRSAAVRALLDEERADGFDRADVYRAFARRVGVVTSSLRTLLGGLRAKGGRIAAYGAAAKGAILLNAAGVGTDLVEFVVDRNPHKVGRYMPGVHIPIREVAALLEDRPDFVLLLAWNLRDEILAQQEEYRRGGGRFIVPIPTPEVA